MARYIDVDALIAEYDRVHIGAPGGARKLMVDAPTADVEEVVRCKDCKWYQESRILPPNKFCFRLKHPVEDRQIGYNFSPDDFCSYGKRKEKKKAIYLRFSDHDCEAWYECPCCGTRFGSWRICGQEPNENGTEKYCPHCKEELDGLD